MRHWIVFERAVMEPLIYLLHSVFCVLFLIIVCIENVCMLYSGSVMGARDGWFARGIGVDLSETSETSFSEFQLSRH